MIRSTATVASVADLLTSSRWPQIVAANNLAHAHRQNIVCHVAHYDYWEQSARANPLHWRKEQSPSNGAEDHRYGKVKGHSG